jgi:L-rhamnose-H+ transport protein
MDPALGIFLNVIGSLAGASFYLPFRKVRNWSWETYWLVCGLFTWIIVPWLIAILTVPDLLSVIGEAPPQSLLWTFIFGMCWGVGGLTFGLSLRYLGMSLGMAMVLGITTIVGTLVPPIFAGEFVSLIMSTSGQVTMAGLFVCLAGIVFAGWAGVSKENEQSPEDKQKYIKDFNFRSGLFVAVISGIMSACFAFAIEAGKPIADTALKFGTSELWKNNVELIFIMGGGFITNAIFCIFMNIKNRSISDYTHSGDASIWINYLFSTIAGIIAFMEFMFYGMAITKMGKSDFVSFSIHLAFIIIFSTMWGWITNEWKGSSKRTVILIVTGILVLILSSVVMGFGNYLSTIG